ncbi:hypothetical protein Ancab_024132 [Ancistrocladus abbreviatus]
MSEELAMADQLSDVTELPRLHLVLAFHARETPDCLISLARNCGGGSISEDVQRFIWEHCISRAGERSHAPYLKNFLKKVIKEVESTGVDVLDEFYEQYAYYMSSVKDGTPVKGNSWIFKYISFLFDDVPNYSGPIRLVCPLRCSLDMLGGDTGCALWPSSLFLSEFILSFPGIFMNKSCFEVGAGVGLLGICLEHVKASKVTLSDGDLSSLANLKFNLEINQIKGTDVVECFHLPWEYANEGELQEFMPDIVLGADVIYNPSCLPHLVRVLSILLDQRKSYSDQHNNNKQDFHPSQTCINGDANDAHDDVDHVMSSYRHDAGEPIFIAGDYKCMYDAYSGKPCLEAASTVSLYHALESGPVAFIACVVRNVDTFSYFITLARQATLVIRDLSRTIRPAKLLPYMQSYPQSDVRLLLISHCN